MARLKLNRFHWHLTDEPAWRIEIKKYPELTNIGAKGTYGNPEGPKAFYTQEDIKEIVAYAAERYIMVIPEIDMPGHANAIGRSYPELSSGGTGRWKDFTVNPATESTYDFIDKVFSEIVELFPAPYIHIGADEVHFGNQVWSTDPQIQAFIKNNYLIDEKGLEHYFVRRVCEIINSKGKKMLGWDEIINSGVTPSKAAIMWWHHEKPEVMETALSRGFDVIMCPRIPCYFDFVQDKSHKIGRRWWQAGEFNSLEIVYRFPEILDSKITNNIHLKGLQACVWSEVIPTKDRLDFITFPRLFAIAEDGWSLRSNKDYTDFLNRTKKNLLFLDGLGIKYFNPFNSKLTPELPIPINQNLPVMD